MKKFGFSKKCRMKQVDFERVYQMQKILQDSLLKIFYLENSFSHSRLGISIGKKVGNSPQRNRVRRIFREAFRLTLPQIQRKYDLILIPKFSRDKIPSYAKIYQSLERLLSQIP
jgi:ribonuclease P protein component